MDFIFRSRHRLCNFLERDGGHKPLGQTTPKGVLTRGFCVPIFSYLLVVGSILTGLLFFADTIIVPGALPLGSQKIGLPKSYKTPTLIPQQYYAP